MGCSTSKTIITWLWYLCAIIILYSSLSHGNVGCNERDRETLEIFKGSIEDPCGLLSSWSTEQDCCHWFGVHCDNLTRRVTELDLHCPNDSTYDECLEGQINLYVLKLEFLSFLDLRYNNFSAIYIPTIRNLSRISTIHHGANFSNLVYLDLSYNNGLKIDDLRGIPRLSSLEYIDLSNVDLSEETLWLQRVNSLPSLRELRLSHCSLKSIQPSLEHTNFSSLEVLDISRNDFHSEVPKWLFNLSSSISSLDLSFNYLKGHLPEELSNFRQLRSLVLKINNFDGPIPEWLGQYKQLEHLDLSGNYFSGPIPETLVNISSLAYLHVGCNLLNGSLPKSLGQHSELQLFRAGNNMLSGSISPFLCQAMTGNTKLMALGLSHNHFSGKILDCSIHNKSHLMAINLRSNNFGGSIPPQICQLSSLLILDLADNKLSGSIPKCLANTATFSYLPVVSHYYDHKRIGQDSSRSYGEYQHLIYRDCSESDDSDIIIVDDIVSSIDLSMNGLSGTIPRELFRLDHLLHLNLSHNGLTGSIPDEIGHMKSLEKLDLSRNQLAGEIPQSMINLNFLHVLDLSYNNLRGKIPWGDQLQSFNASSYMGNSELCGAPLTEDNPEEEIPNEEKEISEGSDDDFSQCFKMGMAIGFAYSFWALCLSLFFINSWRNAYFRFLSSMYDRIYVFIALKKKWLHRHLTGHDI